VRHCAWLNAVPEKPEGDKSDKKEVSRREAFRKELRLSDAEELDMPPCDAGYLLAYLFELGPTLPTGMGDAPISHGEIESWQRNTGICLGSWESRILKRLSNDYLNQAHRSTARDCPSPWEDAPYGQIVLNLKAERTRDALRALANL